MGAYAGYEAALDLGSSEFIRCGIVEVAGPGTANVEDCTASELKTPAFLAWNPGASIRATRCSITGGNTLAEPIGLYVDKVFGEGGITASQLRMNDLAFCAVAVDAGEIELHDSSLTDWRERSVLLRSFNSEPTTIFDFTGNWWGTTDSTAIAASIFDGHDDPNENPQGFVEFWPILDVPLPAKESSFGSFKSHY